MAISDQMEMAFNEQAPQVDPVSGNEVPPGSLPEEVRDDIDAKLSEGEYVVPADVVRFFGVKYFEDLRTEAKMGLANMEADGRIGGEPVDMAAMPPQGMNISEEDIAALEQALTTGAYEGGLMDKMAIAAKNDPMVNSRMNAKGMAVGFAEGGLTESLYNDPTRMDSIIEKVMVAAKSNPVLMEELSKRGVAVNTTQANMNPADIKQANTDTESEKLLEEKSTGFAEGGFNPASYGLGFSTFGPSAPGMGGDTTQVAYYNPTTGENKSFAHYAATNAPVNPIPAGFIMGSAPAVVTNAGMGTGGGGAVDKFGGAAIGESYTKPNGETATRMPDSFYASGGDQEQNRFMQNMMENKDTDPYSFADKYDYSNPSSLTATLMDTIDDKETATQDLLTAGPFGKFVGNSIYLNKARQVNANIAWLKSIGEDANAEKLEEQLKMYITERDVKGDINGGNIGIEDIELISGRTGAERQAAIVADPVKKAKALDKAKRYAEERKDVAPTVTTSVDKSRNISGGDRDQNRAMADLLSTVTTTTDPSGSKVTERSYSDGKGGTFTVGASDDYGTYRGGLMKKKKTNKK